MDLVTAETLSMGDILLIALTPTPRSKISTIKACIFISADEESHLPFKKRPQPPKTDSRYNPRVQVNKT
jgi:hypothetical protein